MAQGHPKTKVTIFLFQRQSLRSDGKNKLYLRSQISQNNQNNKNTPEVNR